MVRDPSPSLGAYREEGERGRASAPNVPGFRERKRRFPDGSDAGLPAVIWLRRGERRGVSRKMSKGGSSWETTSECHSLKLTSILQCVNHKIRYFWICRPSGTMEPTKEKPQPFEVEVSSDRFGQSLKNQQILRWACRRLPRRPFHSKQRTRYSIAATDLAFSRNRNFWILPVEVFTSGSNMKRLGTL